MKRKTFYREKRRNTLIGLAVLYLILLGSSMIVRAQTLLVGKSNGLPITFNLNNWPKIVITDTLTTITTRNGSITTMNTPDAYKYDLRASGITYTLNETTKEATVGQVIQLVI